MTDAEINEITYDVLGQWPSFEAQAWACKVVHAVLARHDTLAYREGNDDAIELCVRDMRRAAADLTKRMADGEHANKLNAEFNVPVPTPQFSPVTAAKVAKLRNKTGSSLAACKDALSVARGDERLAEELLTTGHLK